MTDVAALAESKIQEREEGGAEQSVAPGKKRGPYKKRGRPAGSRTAAKTAPEPEPITKGEIEMFGMLGATIWAIQARFTNMDTLTAEETFKLGQAMAPVARKYIPSMDEYAPEATLIIMVGGLIMAKRRVKKPFPELDEGLDAPDAEIGPQNGTELPQ